MRRRRKSIPRGLRNNVQIAHVHVYGQTVTNRLHGGGMRAFSEPCGHSPETFFVYIWVNCVNISMFRQEIETLAIC